MSRFRATVFMASILGVSMHAALATEISRPSMPVGSADATRTIAKETAAIPSVPAAIEDGGRDERNPPSETPVLKPAPKSYENAPRNMPGGGERSR